VARLTFLRAPFNKHPCSGPHRCLEVQTVFPCFSFPPQPKIYSPQPPHTILAFDALVLCLNHPWYLISLGADPVLSCDQHIHDAGYLFTPFKGQGPRPSFLQKFFLRNHCLLFLPDNRAILFYCSHGPPPKLSEV